MANSQITLSSIDFGISEEKTLRGIRLIGRWNSDTSISASIFSRYDDSESFVLNETVIFNSQGYAEVIATSVQFNIVLDITNNSNLSIQNIVFFVDYVEANNLERRINVN